MLVGGMPLATIRWFRSLPATLRSQHNGHDTSLHPHAEHRITDAEELNEHQSHHTKNESQPSTVLGWLYRDYPRGTSGVLAQVADLSCKLRLKRILE